MSDAETRIAELEKKVAELEQALEKAIELQGHCMDNLRQTTESATKVSYAVANLASENAVLGHGIMWTGTFLEKVIKVAPPGAFADVYGLITENLEDDTKERAQRVLNILAYWKR